MRSIFLVTAAAALAFAAGAAASSPEPELEDAPPCDYGDSNPRLPQAGDDREALYGLMLGQRLRRPDRERVAAALRARFPGAATEAFLAIQFAPTEGTEGHREALEAVIARHAAAQDPDLRREVARARHGLIAYHLNRHVGARMEEGFSWIAEDWRETEHGRRWSAALDRFLADYRGQGPMFDEFIADVEMDAIFRDAAGMTPGDNTGDQRFLRDSDRARDFMRAGMRRMIARYGDSRDERVRLAVARATDMLAPYEAGPSARIPIQRDIIARYKDAFDHALRAEVGGAYHSLEGLLRDTGDAAGAEAVRLERLAYEAARLDSVDCAPLTGR
jgi:hypothetical protein